MNEFTYHNIFETKGMEYILTILFFAILIPFWLMLNRNVKVKENVQNAIGVLTSAILRIPKGLFYNRNHTWIHLEKSGIAKMGVDDFLSHITGNITFSNLLKNGEEVKKGDLLALLEQKGKKLRLFAPVSGKIVASNPGLLENPNLLINDPYDKGWMYAIEPSNWMAETKNCYLADEAEKWVTSEIIRFKDFLAASMKKHSPDASSLVLQDGGELVDHALSGLSEEVWDDFQKEFLN